MDKSKISAIQTLLEPLGLVCPRKGTSRQEFRRSHPGRREASADDDVVSFDDRVGEELLGHLPSFGFGRGAVR